jgi:hypothetical protein
MNQNELTEEINILDFDNALKALNEASETFQVDVWIPSQNKYIKFKEIDAKQQKDLLNAAMDNSVYNSSFLKVFGQIIHDNILDDNLDSLEKIIAVDKASIAISLKNQISNELRVVFDEKNDVIEQIKLEPIIEKFKTYKTELSKTVELKNNVVKIKAELNHPNLKTELAYNQNLNKQYKKADQIKTNEEIQTIISDAFIGETSKYIKKLWINDQEVLLEDLTINQKNAVVEKLPSGLIQKVLEQISLWKKELDSILTVNYQNYTKAISIDSLLFLS